MKYLLTLLVFWTFNLSAAIDKIRLQFYESASTGMAIVWNQVSGSNPVVYYGDNDFGQEYLNYPLNRSLDLQNTSKGMLNSFVLLSDLLPNTRYYFVIVDDEGISQRYYFTTLPNDGTSPLSLIVGGDSRNNRIPRLNANKLVSKLKAHAVLFDGDMTNGDTDLEWQEWLDDWQLTISIDGRITPLIPARGNHEQLNSTISDLFYVPHPEVYYYLNLNNNLLGVYTLNSEISITGNQSDWLSQELELHPNNTWDLAQYHKPMRPHTSLKSENNTIYNAWAQLFYDHDVDLVIECDAHDVKTTFPIIPSNGGVSDEGFELDEQNGTVYTGEGGWGAPLKSADDSKSWTRNSGSFNQFKWLWVYPSKMELRTVKINDADLVSSLTEEERFTLPDGIELFQPNQEEVVYIHHNEDHLPEVVLNAPNDNVHYENEGDVLLSAMANDADGNINKVQFFVDGILVNEDIEAPYEYTSFLAVGAHRIQAKTEDDQGFIVSSNSSTIFIGEFTGSIEASILSVGEDAEEESWGGWGIMDYNSSELNFGSTSFGSNIVGVRFDQINLPKNANITNAFIEFKASQSEGDFGVYSIGITSGVHAAFFSGDFSGLSNLEIGNSVSWEPENWESDLIYKTPNLSSLIQDAVANESWLAGNAISFIIEGEGNRTAYSYDNEAEVGPKLIVHYEVNFSPIGSEKVSNQSFDFRIIPNPFEYEPVLVVEGLNGQSWSATIYDLSGKLVFEGTNYYSTKAQLPLKSLSRGTYYIEVRCGNESMTQGMVKY